MNHHVKIWLGTTFIVAILQIASADTNMFSNKTFISTNEGVKLPAKIGFYEINDEVCSEANKLESKDLQIKYLSSVIQKMHDPATENSRKASAIRLLGFIASTNTIDVLVSSISFGDVKHGDFPAVQSLTNIGAPAIPKLLAMVEGSTNKMELYCAVQTLKKINGSKYQEFVQQQKSVMPHARWIELLRYDVDW